MDAFRGEMTTSVWLWDALESYRLQGVNQKRLTGFFIAEDQEVSGCFLIFVWAIWKDIISLTVSGSS